MAMPVWRTPERLLLERCRPVIFGHRRQSSLSKEPWKWFPSMANVVNRGQLRRTGNDPSKGIAGNVEHFQRWKASVQWEVTMQFIEAQVQHLQVFLMEQLRGQVACNKVMGENDNLESIQTRHGLESVRPDRNDMPPSSTLTTLPSACSQ